MPSDTDDQSVKFWNTVSKRLGNTTNMAGSPALRAMQEHGYSYIQPTYKVLDVGCGKGDITIQMAQYAEQVQGLDTSEGMIGVARRKEEAYQLDNVEFLHTDLFDDQFEAASFDQITTFNVLPYIHEKDAFYARIHQLLKPGGLFLSSTACLGQRITPTRVFMWLLKSLRVVPRMTFYKTDGLESEIAEAGFAIEKAMDIAKLPERLVVAKKK